MGNDEETAESNGERRERAEKDEERRKRTKFENGINASRQRYIRRRPIDLLVSRPSG
jgi:hypothetical protein